MLIRLPQAVPGWETIFEGTDGDIVKIVIHFIILSLEHVTAHTRIAFVGLSGVHTSLSKPSILFISITLKVRKVTMLLGSSWFRLMGACLIRA